MKHTYLTPSSEVISVATADVMLISSMPVSEQTVSEGWVKDQGAARNYDVWNDDWSK